MPTKCVVTGATGFIGSSLVRTLAARGITVRAVARHHSHHPFLDDLTVEVVRCDLSDRTALHKAFTNCDWLFHTAALVRYNRHALPELLSTNVEGLRNVLQAAADAGVGRVVFVDSVAVFGTSQDPYTIRDERADMASCSPLFPYTYSKLLGRRVIAELDAHVPITTVYSVPVYGAGDKYEHTGSLIRTLFRSRPPLAPPGGTSTIVIEDLVEACIAVAQSGKVGESYIAASEKVSFLDLFNLILEALNQPHRIQHVVPRSIYPLALLTASIADRLWKQGPSPYLIRNGFGYRYFSAEKMTEELSWHPRASLRDAIAEEAAFLGINVPSITRQSRAFQSQ